MSGIFISHSSRDNAEADELAERLQQQGYQSLFLDFDPFDGIPAGRNWEREIYAKLSACSGVILLCSGHSMASDWCFAEITQARAQGKHLFPVKIAPCTLRPILLDTQVIDLTGDREEGYNRLWRGLLNAGLDPADFFKWDESRPPYPGLVPFVREDVAVYYGRDDDRRSCLGRLEQMKRSGSYHTLILLGASGSGKSSLVHAGVVPRLERITNWCVLQPMRPRAQPIQELSRVLCDAFARSGDARDWQAVTTRLQDIQDDLALVAMLEELRKTSEQPQTSLLLVLDQLEELVTTSDDAAARRFVTLLKNALNAESSQIFCLATLQSDYLTTLQCLPFWQDPRIDKMVLNPLTAAHYTEIIRKPALLSGIELETGLVETMVHDAGTANALPLLAFTLNRLWREYGNDKRITLEEYRDSIGGIEGAIRHEAEAVLASCGPGPAQLEKLRRAFMDMAWINEQGQYTRQTLHWSDVHESIHGIMEAFVSARLLVSGVDETPGTGNESTRATYTRTLEVAHEALFRAWDRLKRWLDEDRTFKLWLQHVKPEAEAWQQNRTDDGLLLRGGPLAEAERWLGQRKDDIKEPVCGYITASGEVMRRKRFIWRMLQGSISIALIMVSLLAFAFWHQRTETVKQLINSYWSIGIAARDAEAEKDPIRAAHYFARVADLSSGKQERANALISAGMLTGGLYLKGMLVLPEAPGGAWSRPDGTLVALWMGSTAQLLDLDTGRVLASTNHRDGVRKAAYSTAGILMSLSKDGRIHLSQSPGDTQELPQTGVRDAEMDSKGTRLLSRGNDHVLRLWQLPSGEEAARLDAGQPIEGARFLKGSGRVLIWSGQGTLQLWQPSTGQVTTWQSGCAISGFTVSSDESALLSWCERTLHVHDLQQGRLLRSWSSPELIDGAEFAPAISAIISWGYGPGRVWIWNATDGTPLSDGALEHGGALVRVLPVAGGRRLVTSGADGRIRLWDLAGQRRTELARANHDVDKKQVYAVLSEDGTRTLGWSGKAGARLWDTATMTPLSLPLLHAAPVAGALFYDDDQGIVTWGQDAVLRIWRRAADRELTAPVVGQQTNENQPEQSGCQTKNLDEDVQTALEDRLGAVGLSDYRALDRCDDRRLVVAGAEASVIEPGDRATPAPPRMRLGEEIRGGILEADGRVVLWGIASLRLWDGSSGRPLSATLGSDVFNPKVTRIADGLLTRDAETGRDWRWPTPSLTGRSAEQWLQTISGTRLDAEGITRAVMDHAAWCDLARQAPSAPVGCGP
jgi:WD40 repeat protein